MVTMTRSLSRLARLGLMSLSVSIVACQSVGERNESMMPSNQNQQQGQRANDDIQRGQAPAGDRLESARIRTELAFNYFQRGQLSIALEEIRSALASNPNYATAYNVLALINMDLGQNPQAEEAFRKGLTLAPNDSDILNNYGWFLCQTKRERESIERFLQALKNPLYPTPDKPYLNAGICSQRMGDEASAEDYFRKAFSLDPLNAGALMRLGELYFKRNDIEKARFYMERVNKNYEPSAESLWLALRIERKAGDRASESSYAAQLRRRYPNSNEHLLMQQGKFE